MTHNNSKKNPEEEIFVDKETQFKLQLAELREGVGKWFSLKNNRGRTVAAATLFVVVLALIFSFRNQFTSLIDYLRPTKKVATVSAKPNAFSNKIATSMLQGSVIGLDLAKKQITVAGQVDTAITVVEVNYNEQTVFTKVTFDSKTQEKLSTSQMTAAQIKVNDIIQVKSSKLISDSIAVGDLVSIEVLRSQGK